MQYWRIIGAHCLLDVHVLDVARQDVRGGERKYERRVATVCVLRLYHFHYALSRRRATAYGAR